MDTVTVEEGNPLVPAVGLSASPSKVRIECTISSENLSGICSGEGSCEEIREFNSCPVGADKIWDTLRCGFRPALSTTGKCHARPKRSYPRNAATFEWPGFEGATSFAEHDI